MSASARFRRLAVPIVLAVLAAAGAGVASADDPAPPTDPGPVSTVSTVARTTPGPPKPDAAPTATTPTPRAATPRPARPQPVPRISPAVAPPAQRVVVPRTVVQAHAAHASAAIRARRAAQLRARAAARAQVKRRAAAAAAVRRAAAAAALRRAQARAAAQAAARAANRRKRSVAVAPTASVGPTHSIWPTLGLLGGLMLLGAAGTVVVRREFRRPATVDRVTEAVDVPPCPPRLEAAPAPAPAHAPATAAGFAAARAHDPPPPSELAPGPRASPVCRVEWWRGYMRSQFLAVLPDTGGRAQVVAESRPFRWNAADPPGERADAVAAFHGLAEQLEGLGWEPGDRFGDTWFEVQFHPVAVGSNAPPSEG